MATFWPELDQHHARAALRNALYFLRTHLGAGAVRTGNEDAVGLDPGEVWCDLDAFDVAVRMRDHATAYQLYRGAVLESLFVPDARPFEEWLDGQRRRRSTEAREAASQAARRHAAAGRLEEALEWARRARGMAPLNEDAARLLIALRHLTGDRAGALDEYRRFETLLDTEHGVAPSADTQRLVKAIRDPHTHAESVANTIAQVPLPPLTTPRGSPAVNAHARTHDRTVLEALVQTRLGLARRRGERVGVVLVAFDPPGTSAGAAPSVAALDALGESVLSGVRVADFVGVLDAHTLAILPCEDGAMDVNALVGRLSRHLKRVASLDPASPCARANRIDTLWLDPLTGRTASELLADAGAAG